MSFCTNCGAPTSPDQRYCTVCGHPVAPATAMALTSARGQGEWPVTGEEARVLLGLAATAPRQSRWSVLARLVLSLPLLVWLMVVSVVAFFALIGAWFAALVTGRVPDAVQGFLTNVRLYSAKVDAYSGLLIARWPGFSLRARAGDQVSLAIDHVDLNRWSVLFRVVLAIPSLVVSSVVNLGGSLATVVMWVCALAWGRVPQPLHEARAQIWRFTIRVSAFIELLTPSQPFGDFFGQGAPSDDVDAPPLSTRATLSSNARVIFILALLTGAYLQLQPGLVGWPVSYVLDRTAGPSLLSTINDNIVIDLANYTSRDATCTSTGFGACPVDAATTQSAVDRQRRLLHNFEQFVVQGRDEYFAYEHQVLVIELTLEQAANAPASEQLHYRTLVLNEQSALASLYESAHRAL